MLLDFIIDNHDKINSRKWALGFFFGVFGIIGVVFLILFAANHSREDALTIYNNAVTNWTRNSIADSVMSHASFTIVNPVIPALTVNTTFRNTGPDYQGISDSNKNGVPTYVSGYFQVDAGGSVVASTINFKATNKKNNTTAFSVPIKVTQMVTDDTYNWWGCRNYACNANSTSSCWTTPTCRDVCYGEYWGSFDWLYHCTYPVVINSVCIRVVDNGNGFQLDTSKAMYPDVGCYQENDFYPGHYIKWAHSPASYQFQLTAVDGAFIIPDGVTVRHADDPLIVASQITHGTYSFGLSGTQKLIIGAVFAGAAGVCLLIHLGSLFAAWVNKRRSEQRAGISIPKTTTPAIGTNTILPKTSSCNQSPVTTSFAEKKRAASDEESNLAIEYAPPYIIIAENTDIQPRPSVTVKS